MKLIACLFAGVVVLGAAVVVKAQNQAPPDWKWRTDTPARWSEGDKVGADQFFFVRMAPGWHITMGPGGVLFPSGREIKGNFTVEASVFLFPGTSQEGYGIFLGGRDLEGTSASSYVSFLARRDGRIAIMKHMDGVVAPLLTWTMAESVLTQGGPTAEAAKNSFRVDVSPDTVTFAMNGKTVAQVPRPGLPVDGVSGFRIGRDINLHATTFDVTERFAPVPVKK